MSLRDAVDRSRAAVTAAARPAEELERLYQQATATGDKLLRYATFRRAVESGLSAEHPVVGSYLDERGLREAYEIVNSDENDELIPRIFDHYPPPPPPIELLGRQRTG